MRDFNCIIMGAAGRDFHDFQTFFREHPTFRVRCFTAHQIPFIEQRVFPRALAGDAYAEDIPIFPEERLAELIARFDVDFVFLSYSDLSHVDVMHKASIVQAAGASFALLGPRHTELASRRPVISVTASRTGAGKSPLARALAAHLAGRGLSVGIVRHPMPYGDLRRQAVQCFRSAEDIDAASCTVEEREEYEPYLDLGLRVYAGVDYRSILRAAEADSDVILWDGGNNDGAFFRAGLKIVVLDALRPGDELAYYPGETNFRRADVLVVNKVSEAHAGAVERVRRHARETNPGATVIEADLEVRVDRPERIAGKRVLVVEDGPTLTHGGMAFGAGTIAARRFHAAELLDPRPHAVGTIASALAQYPHLERVLPALGYSDEQRRELSETIRRTAPDVVVDGSPARLERLLTIDVPLVDVSYAFVQRSGPAIEGIVDGFVAANA
jgi:predicted GTPase